LAARSESIESAMYRACWVPRSRFAVGPRPGCAVFHRRVGPITVKQAAADSRRASASLWSFAQQPPARPPQQTGDSHGLLFPSAHAGFGDRFFFAGRLPFSQRFRLQGLAALLTVSSRRIRAGFVSHRQRSWDSPFGAFPSRIGARSVSTRADPHADCSSGSQRRARRRGRPGRPRLLGFDPCRSPLQPPCY
jgi:hypothetical protein